MIKYNIWIVQGWTRDSLLKSVDLFPTGSTCESLNLAISQRRINRLKTRLGSHNYQSGLMRGRLAVRREHEFLQLSFERGEWINLLDLLWQGVPQFYAWKSKWWRGIREGLRHMEIRGTTTSTIRMNIRHRYNVCSKIVRAKTMLDHKKVNQLEITDPVTYC